MIANTRVTFKYKSIDFFMRVNLGVRAGVEPTFPHQCEVSTFGFIVPLELTDTPSVIRTIPLARYVPRTIFRLVFSEPYAQGL